MSHSTTKAPYKSLKQLALDAGVTVEKLIADAVEAHGGLRPASRALGIGMPSLQWWLARNGYRVETTTTSRIIKVMEPIEASQS